jgi:hypothetical protein
MLFLVFFLGTTSHIMTPCADFPFFEFFEFTVPLFQIKVKLAVPAECARWMGNPSL